MATSAEILKLTTVHGLSAAQIRSMIPARCSKAAKEHLGALIGNRLAKTVKDGGIPKLPSRKLYAELTGEDFVFDREQQRTRKQLKAGTPTIAARKAKANKRTKKAKPSKAKVTTADLAAKLKDMPQDEVLAMFTKLFG